MQIDRRINVDASSKSDTRNQALTRAHRVGSRKTHIHARLFFFLCINTDNPISRSCLCVFTISYNIKLLIN